MKVVIQNLGCDDNCLKLWKQVLQTQIQLGPWQIYNLPQHHNIISAFLRARKTLQNCIFPLLFFYMFHAVRTSLPRIPTLWVEISLTTIQTCRHELPKSICSLLGAVPCDTSGEPQASNLHFKALQCSKSELQLPCS